MLVWTSRTLARISSAVAVDRSEVEHHARVLGQPGLDVGGGVGGQVVQHHVDVPAGMGFDGFLEEREEVRAVAGGLALAEHLAGADVQRGEQVGRAVPDIVVGAFLAGIERDRQQWLGTVQGLNLGGRSS
jgi:hypothetical protein